MSVAVHGNSGTVLEVAAYRRAQLICDAPRAAGYALTGVTGTMAAALGANSSVFAMRLDPSAGATYKALIKRIRLQYTTIVAYTTPITAARRLALFRGAGAAASGSTATPPVKKDTANGNSQFLAAEGGDARISNTGALTVTGITYETDPIRTMTLTHLGAAGAYGEALWEFSENETGECLTLNQGELIAIRNPAAMDAAGTWQLAVNVDWIEGAGL